MLFNNPYFGDLMPGRESFVLLSPGELVPWLIASKQALRMHAVETNKVQGNLGFSFILANPFILLSVVSDLFPCFPVRCFSHMCDLLLQLNIVKVNAKTKLK